MRCQTTSHHTSRWKMAVWLILQGNMGWTEAVQPPQSAGGVADTSAFAAPRVTELCPTGAAVACEGQREKST
eukprot:CAMPEP_0197895654 /NCGR_PEP_ID=MMETSP1439-20131203/37820_1 /TAXON_ID=66791 /ORGANISM="Gonyaulax spinifera, Strain CCMP409" /LENGTH=71 /DNA_ID=CAMNT_0043516111 /DNA_START=62 /DNA_END=273 /DNA_ORIENTATION=+